MKRHEVLQIVLKLSLSIMSLTGCSQTLTNSQAIETPKAQIQAPQAISSLQDKSRPNFQSDEQLKTNFPKHKAELLTLIQRCKVEQKSQALKRDIRQAFSICKVDSNVLKLISAKEIAVEFRRTQPLPYDFNGGRVLFVTDYYKKELADTFVEEKGYMYSSNPIKQDVIENGTLEQSAGRDLFESRSRKEAWRYKQVAPNWYIYYRQYFYPYLG
jgi:hypothetical protein